MSDRARADFQLLKEERERRMQESSDNSLRLVEESIHVGAAAADELYRQGEALDRTERRLDDIEDDLKTTRHHIRSIKSVFASLFSRSPKDERKSEETLPEEGRSERLDTSAVREKADLMWEASSSDCQDPVDRDLVGVSRGLDQLKAVAVAMGDELDRHKPRIERITEKATRVDDQIRDQDRQIRKILKN